MWLVSIEPDQPHHDRRTFQCHIASIRKRSLPNTTNKAMAIHRLIAIGTFGPDEIKAMTAAYESALTDLGFADREDPLTELIANRLSM